MLPSKENVIEGEFVPLVDVNSQMNLRELRAAHQLNLEYHTIAARVYKECQNKVLKGENLNNSQILQELIKKNPEAKLLLLEDLGSKGDSAQLGRVGVLAISSEGQAEQQQYIEKAEYPVPTVSVDVKSALTKLFDPDIPMEQWGVLRGIAETALVRDIFSGYERKLSTIAR